MSKRDIPAHNTFLYDIKTHAHRLLASIYTDTGWYRGSALRQGYCERVELDVGDFLVLGYEEGRFQVWGFIRGMYVSEAYDRVNIARKQFIKHVRQVA